MKKLISAFIILLAMLIVLPGCTPPGNGNPSNTGESDSTTNQDTTIDSDSEKNDSTDTPVSDTEYDYWYCQETSAVLAIANEKHTNPNAAKFYSLSIGYYEYYMVDEASFTFDGTTLTLLLDGESYDFTYSDADDTLTLSTTGISSSGEATTISYVYVRRSDEPTQHAVYEFPDFTTVQFPATERLLSADKLNVTQYIETARLDIFHSYYSSSIEEYRLVTDRSARRGDYVNIDYIGYHNGVAFQGGSANGSMVSIIENSGFVDGFVYGIIGHKPGETFDVNVTFPADYGNTTLAGQPVTFKITLNEIYDITLTEEQFGNYENIGYDTYEDYVMGTAKEKAAESIFTLLTIQSGINDVIPDEAYMYFYQYQVDQAHYMATYYNLPYETYLSYFGLSETSMEVQAKTVALDYIVAFHIAKTNNLTWTEEEYQAQYDSFIKELTDSGYTKAEAEEYVNTKQINYLKATLTYKIASTWFIDQVFSNR